LSTKHRTIENNNEIRIKQRIPRFVDTSAYRDRLGCPRVSPRASPQCTGSCQSPQSWRTQHPWDPQNTGTRSASSDQCVQWADQDLHVRGRREGIKSTLKKKERRKERMNRERTKSILCKYWTPQAMSRANFNFLS
jgi:hypothetical protein